MKRAALLAVLLVGCEGRIYSDGVMSCPPGTVYAGSDCVSVAGVMGCSGLGTLFFWLWVAATISTTRNVVMRIERKLNERPPAPPPS